MALRQLSTLSWTPPATPRAGGIGFASFGPLTGITRIRVTHKASNAGFLIDSAADLVDLQFPELVTIQYTDYHGVMSVQNCPNLLGVDLSKLQQVVGGNLIIANNPKLTVVLLTAWIPEAGLMCSFSGNDLIPDAVNLILARCVANPQFGLVPFSSVFLQGGTNSPPTGQGVLDKATLIARGASVQTN